MRILGGWIALTPELSAKLLLGRHVWDNAQHADALGKRLPELRAHAQMSEPANAAFVAFMNAIEEPERPGQTVERLVGVYRVLKPHLLASYEDHLRRVNSVYEPPTERILMRLVEDERRHVAAGSRSCAHLSATPELAERGEAWQAQLEGLLAAAGGVTGGGLARAGRPRPRAPSASALNDDPRQFIRLEQSLDPLADARGARGGARARSAPRWSRATRPDVERWLAPALPRRRAAGGRLAGLAPASHRVVAFAKIGDKRAGQDPARGRRAPADGAATLLTRWAPRPDGWRVEVVDALGVDLLRARLTSLDRERPRREPGGDRPPGHPRVPGARHPRHRRVFRGGPGLAACPRRRSKRWPSGRRPARESYLDMDRLIEAARAPVRRPFTRAMGSCPRAGASLARARRPDSSGSGLRGR